MASRHHRTSPVCLPTIPSAYLLAYLHTPSVTDSHSQATSIRRTRVSQVPRARLSASRLSTRSIIDDADGSGRSHWLQAIESGSIEASCTRRRGRRRFHAQTARLPSECTRRYAHTGTQRGRRHGHTCPVPREARTQARDTELPVQKRPYLKVTHTRIRYVFPSLSRPFRIGLSAIQMLTLRGLVVVGRAGGCVSLDEWRAYSTISMTLPTHL